jgi:ABC-type nitrate/sulfonate/bicarbonate transport system substrate-binding protein
LRIGFLPVSDCAPVVYAYEAGLFAKYELDVELRRETGWASIRDKVINGELDAAHAPAALPFLANLGLGSDQCECVTGLVLNLQGNAITLSRQLWEQGVRDAATLRETIYRRWGKQTYTFGIACPLASQEFLLRQWLRTGGIVPEAEVRLVVISPTQMFPMLKLGYIDGYCVDEPWTSVAVQAGAGVCVATSAELAPLHPEKVIMVRQSYSAGRAEEHERLLAAVLEACAFCDRPENHTLLSEMLAQPHYVNAPADCLEAGLAGPLESGGHGGEKLFDLNIFHRHHANEPTDDKAAWVMKHLKELLEEKFARQHASSRVPVLKNVFRCSIHERARKLLSRVEKQIAAEVESYETLVKRRRETLTAPFSGARPEAAGPA